MTPTDYVAQQSVAFVQRHHTGGGRLLDVGCGNGEVAAALTALGFDVTAIDPAADKVDRARALGVDAHVRGLLQQGGGPFDVIFFGYSLHHIDRARAAITHAKGLLAPDGVLLLLELGFELPEATRAWIRGMEAPLIETGTLGESMAFFARDDDAAAPDSSGGTGHHHQHQHDHGREDMSPIHHGLHDLRTWVDELVGIQTEELLPGAYLFWAQNVARPQVVARLHALEQQGLAAGWLAPIGRCWVCRP